MHAVQAKESKGALTPPPHFLPKQHRGPNPRNRRSRQFHYLISLSFSRLHTHRSTRTHTHVHKHISLFTSWITCTPSPPFLPPSSLLPPSLLHLSQLFLSHAKNDVYATVSRDHLAQLAHLQSEGGVYVEGRGVKGEREEKGRGRADEAGQLFSL